MLVYQEGMHKFSSDGLRPRDASSLPSRQVRKGGLPLLHTKPLPEGRPLPICASLQCREELRKAKLSPWPSPLNMEFTVIWFFIAESTIYLGHLWAISSKSKWSTGTSCGHQKGRGLEAVPFRACGSCAFHRSFAGWPAICCPALLRSAGQKIWSRGGGWQAAGCSWKTIEKHQWNMSALSVSSLSDQNVVWKAKFAGWDWICRVSFHHWRSFGWQHMGWICWIHVLKPTPPQSSPQSKATIAHPNQFLRTHVALQFWRTRHHYWWNEMNITAENWLGSQEVATCNVCLVGWSGTGHRLPRKENRSGMFQSFMEHHGTVSDDMLPQNEVWNNFLTPVGKTESAPFFCLNCFLC